MRRSGGRPCPGGCGRRVYGEKFLCPTHWYQVDRRLRDRIWRLYRDAPGSPDHRAAVLEAIRAVLRKQAARR